MNKTINFLEKQVKIFELVKCNQVAQYEDKLYFNLDEKVQYLLGIVIDGYYISLEKNSIYPVFEDSEYIELDKYYISNIYDYGTMLPWDQGTFTIKEEPEKMKKLYDERVEWYYNAVLKNAKQTVISFEEAKALRNK